MGEFRMPSLGADMEAGTLVEWLKKPGDAVRRGDIVAVVETEKGAIEIEIFESGRLDALLVAPGTKVPVGTVLATVSGTGNALSAPTPTASSAEPVTPPPPTPRRPLPAPSAVFKPSAVAPALRASPAARKLAGERSIDLGSVKGTGPSGTVTREDVVRAAEAAVAGPPDLAPMRRAIAAAMARSKRDIPHYYLSHSFDIGAARNWLDAFNAAQPAEDRILIGTLLVKAVAIALREFPELNGFFEADGRRPSEAIHVGIAIAIRGGGLAAPAIHDTDKLSLPALMKRMADLVGRVRHGGFRSSEISDPTVTVTSLGDRGVEALLPVIYPPQVAIVGFGAVQRRSWVVDDKIEIRPVVTASLAADHRVSDGHRGALFLRRVEELLRQPEAL
jgi:pyruvate dehydrogenase E2 component (dihydrolipoamide acetyltransferase)